MEAFLKRAKSAITDGDTDLTLLDVHVVIGNESADLDSVVSCITLGYMLHCQENAPKDTLVVPVVNCLREELPLRTEVIYWLRKHIISLDWLLYREDLTRWWAQTKAASFRSFSATLVDHHYAVGELEFVQPAVVRILDHHAIVPAARQKVAELREAGQLSWALVGSCCSLVADRLFGDGCPALLLDPDASTTVLSLLYGVILLDTLCLNPHHDRFLPLDVEMLERIEEKLGFIKDSRQRVYREIEDAKFDVSNFTNSQLLRRDVKFCRPHVAIASFSGLDYEAVVTRKLLNEDINSFGIGEKVRVVIILTLGSPPPRAPASQLRRGILMCKLDSDHSTLALELTELLCRDANLGLKPLPTSNPRIVAFAQANAALSRKYILPLVAKFLSDWPTSEQAIGLRTPLNSPHDEAEAAAARDRALPTMNNRAMVQSVKEKRSKINATDDPV